METIHIIRGYGVDQVYKAELIKRTPTGQTVVKTAHGSKRFGKDGYEMDAGSQWHKDRIISEDDYNNVLERAKRRNRVRGVSLKIKDLDECFNRHMDTVDKPMLLARLKDLTEAAEAI